MTTATNGSKTKMKKLDLTIAASSMEQFVSKMNGLMVSTEMQKQINDAIESYFADIENTLQEEGKDEITITDFVKALRQHGIKIQVNGLKNEHLGTIITTLSPQATKFDWKAFGITVLKYSAIAGVGAGVGYYGSQYLQNRRNGHQAQEAHRNSNVTTISRRAA